MQLGSVDRPERKTFFHDVICPKIQRYDYITAVLNKGLFRRRNYLNFFGNRGYGVKLPTDKACF